MVENKRFTLNYINEQSISANLYDGATFVCSIGIGEELILELLNCLSKENEQLIKDNFELQGLLGDVRALLRLNKVDDAISRIDKFERSMKK